MKYSHIALSASAGSGKTFALSVRFIALVLAGSKLSDIIALTFTKKAVGEMKERIERLFCDLAAHPAELACLCELLGQNERWVLNEAANRMDEFLSAELKIFTFDSFFARILRLFASYLGLRPDFALKDELDIKAAFLDSLEQSHAQQILQLLNDFDISLPSFLDAMDKIYQNYTGNFIQPKDYEFVDLYEKFRQLLPHFLACKNKKIAEWCEGVNSAADILKKPSLGLLNSATANKIAEQNAEFALAQAELASCVCEYLAAKEAELLKLAFAYAKRYAAAAKKLHQESGELSFSDVAIYVHQILNDAQLKDLFYFRLNCELKHLLIDEFQDTSILQYEIIKPLVAEITAGLGINDAPKSFFYVGDKKQSIYAFRGANQAVFDLFLANKNYQIQPQFLDTNYRSSAEVVRFCNEVFSQSAYGKDFIPARAAKGGGGMVKVFSSREKEYLELVLACINNLSGEVCILVRTNAQAQELSDFLAANGVAAISASAKELLDDVQIRTLLEYAKYCVFGDEAYLEFCKRTLGFAPPRLELDLLRPGKEIFMYLSRSLGLEISKNLLDFIALSKDEFLDNLYEESSAKSSEQAAERVVIMTVHKSKGLQFDNVICLHLNSRAASKAGLELAYDFAKSAWDGSLVSTKDLENLRIANDENYAQKAAARQKSEHENELNIIYVAYTRAKNCLIIIKDEDVKLPVQLPFFNDASELNAPHAAAISQIGKTAQSASNYRFDAQIKAQKAKSYAQNDEIVLGLAFHYFCELSDFGASSLPECLRLAHERYFLAPFSELEHLAQRLIACAAFQNLINGKYLLKEQTFYSQEGEHRVDLIAYCEREICIIDYKSGAENSSYTAQLLRYKNALISCDFAALAGILNAPIRCFLLIFNKQLDEFELKEVFF